VNAICLRNRPDFTLHEIVRPKGLLSPHGLAGEDVIVIRCVDTLTAPAEKILRCGGRRPELQADIVQCTIGSLVRV
jgi:hypothetical protein